MDVPLPPIFIVLCGKTGSGKTQVLHHLESSGYPVIDLEKIASHRGSAFGGLLLNAQPAQTDFDSEIEKSFLKYDHCTYIFTEHKPSSLGKRKIPGWLYKKIEQGIFVLLDVDKKRRINNILGEYKAAGKEGFMNSLHKLKERLPDTVMKECEAFLQSENYYAFIENMLSYYDGTNKYNLRDIDLKIEAGNSNSLEIMHQLLKNLKQSGAMFLTDPHSAG